MSAVTDTIGRRKWACVIAVVILLTVAGSCGLIMRFGASTQGLVYVGLAVLLAIVVLCDIYSRIIPNKLVSALLLLWVASVWFMPCGLVSGSIGATFVHQMGYGVAAVALDGVVGGLVLSGASLLLALVLERRGQQQAFGGGDIKLLGAVGLFLGLPASLGMLFVACLLTLAYAVCMQAMYLIRQTYVTRATPNTSKTSMDSDVSQSKLDQSLVCMTLPFAPAIACATVLSLTLGPFPLF